MAAPPLSPGVAALVLEPHRYAVPREAPQVLLEPVVELAFPLAGKEVPDRLPPLEELVPVAPHRVLRVGHRHLLGVAGVPGVLGCFDLLPRRLLVERRKRRPAALVLVALLHLLVPLSDRHGRAALVPRVHPHRGGIIHQSTMLR